MWFVDRLRVIDAQGNERGLSYDSLGRVVGSSFQFVRADGSIETLTQSSTFDRNGNLTSTEDIFGGTKKANYNSAGKPVSISDARGNTSSLNYDSRGLLQQYTLPDGATEAVERDTVGRISRYIDADGKVSDNTFDAAGRPVSFKRQYDDLTALDDAVTQVEYDAVGRASAIIGPAGYRTGLSYDASGRIVGVNAVGVNTAIQLDPAGNEVARTDANGKQITSVLDPMGRPTLTQFPAGNSFDISFDEVGNLTSAADSTAVQSDYEYDELDRLVAVVAGGARTTYTYDPLGQPAQTTDANGHATHFSYSINPVFKFTVTKPLGQQSEVTFDKVGNISAVQNFNGENILYVYDELNRPVTKQLPDGTVSQISYSPTNKIETISDARGETQYLYNAQDRLQRRIDPNGLEIAYEYDAAGNITAITTPSGTSTYELDINGRLGSVTDAQGKVTSYSYDVLGNLVKKQLPNGTVEQRNYDSFDRLTRVSFIASNATVLQQFSYEYDSAGFFSTVTDQDGQVMNFGYDQFGRLEMQRIALTGVPERVIQYEYDAVGNRVRSLDSEDGTTLFVYDANDRLLSRENLLTGVRTDYSYDANGSLVYESSAARSVRYNRDANRRISRTEIIENGITTSIDYEYDLVNNRVAEIRDGVRTDFVIDTSGKYSRVLDELNASGDVLVSYTYGDELISQSRDGVAYYYLTDLHSGIRALQTDSEQFVNEYMYDAFGSTLQSSGNATNTYKYRSERQDVDTENYYLRARVYDAKSGRFLSTDPDPGSTYLPVSQHPYLYANANPVMFSDPGGENTIAEFAIAGLISTTLAAISMQVYAKGAFPICSG